MPLQKQVVSLDLQGIDKKEDPLKGIPSKPVRLDDAVFEESNSIRMRNIVAEQSNTVLNAPTNSSFPPTNGSVTYSGPARVFTNMGSLLIESRKSGVYHRVIKDQGLSLVDMAESRFTDSDGTITIHAMKPGASATTTQVGNAVTLADLGSGVNENAFQYDCAGFSTRSCWAVEQGLYSGIMIYVVDEASGDVIYNYQLRDTTGSNVIVCNPRVIYSTSANKFYVYYAQYTDTDTSFVVRRLEFSSTGAVTAPTAQTVFTSAVSGSAIGPGGNECLFDVVNDQILATRLFFLVRDVDASWTLRFRQLNAADGYTAVSTASQVPASKPTALTALVTSTNAAKWYHALFSNATTAYAYGWNEPGVGGVGALATLSSSANSGRITAWSDNAAAAGYFEMYVEDFAEAISSTPSAANRANVAMRHILVSKDLSGDFGTRIENTGFLHARVTMNNAAADPTSDAGATYRGAVSTAMPSRDQPTVLLYDHYGFSSGRYAASYPPVSAYKEGAQHPVGRVAPGEAGYDTVLYKTTRRVPSGFWKSATEYVLPHTKFVADVQLEYGESVTPFVLARTDFDFASQLGQSEVNGVTVMAGACPSLFDGQSVYEEGAHIAPEILDSSLTPAASGTYAFPNNTATFNICFTYGWTDARGNWHESAPSNIISVSITAGSGNYSVSPNILQPPTRKSQRRLILYRTLSGVPAGPYYRAYGINSSTPATEAQLVNQEQLYTNPSSTVGAPLFHTPMRSHRQSCVFQNRIWSFGCDDGYRIDFTNVVQEGRAPEPNELLYRRVPTSMGRLVGGAALDGKLFVFGERQIGVLYGTGPTDSGAQDNYSEVEVIVPDTGASWGSPKSIIATKEGVWFFSQLGIRLLGRDGQIVRKQDGKEAGSEVDEYCTTQYQETPMLVAVQAGNPQQIRFYGTLGSVSNCCLVYDCFWKQWSRFTNHGCVDAAYADGRFYHVRSDADIWYYGVLNNGGNTDPDGTPLQVVLETPWLSFGGVQGFQRVYGLQMLTTYIPQADGTDTQNIAYSINVAYDREAVGTDYKVNIEPTGVNDSVLELLYKLDRQKCSALRFKLTFKLTNDVMFRISDLALLVGIKGGLNRTANRI